MRVGAKVDPAHLRLFRTTLAEDAPHESLFQLARHLRDGGLSQASLYSLFSYFQQRLSPEDPRYDAVADNMDLVCGGPWAKGHALFPTELEDPTATRGDRLVTPEPWVEVDVSGDANLEAELAREVGAQHPLSGCPTRALMRRTDNDEVLFALRDRPEVAVVHLTWSGSCEPIGFPRTTLFPSMLDWHDELEGQTTR